MRRIRTYHEVADPGSEDIVAQVVAQSERLARRLADVGMVVVVASGKGGVGKSAVAANLAAGLASGGRAVGAVDADLNGPSLARMLGARGPLEVGPEGVEPACGAAGVRVMSMDLLLAAEDAPLAWREPDEGAFAWRGVLETGALRELVADTRWGTLDVLVVDAPPGSDKVARLIELLPRIDVLIVVTTPSDAARHVVAKSVRLARERGVDPIALVANMTAWRCPHCGQTEAPFAADGARALAEATGLPTWAEVPLDPRMGAATDAGRPYVLEAPDSAAGRALRGLADEVARRT